MWRKIYPTLTNPSLNTKFEVYEVVKNPNHQLWRLLKRFHFFARFPRAMKLRCCDIPKLHMQGWWISRISAPFSAKMVWCISWLHDRGNYAKINQKTFKSATIMPAALVEQILSSWKMFLFIWASGYIKFRGSRNPQLQCLNLPYCMINSGMLESVKREQFEQGASFSAARYCASVLLWQWDCSRLHHAPLCIPACCL